MLVKIDGEGAEAEKRYSPAECLGAQKKTITGSPDPKHISTSYIERQNLTMYMRRFTRLTNGFSKKLETHIAAISWHFMYHNFVKIHGTLRVTPAMAAGVTEKLWDMGDIVALVEEYREERQQEGRENAKKAIEDSYSQGPAFGH